MVKNLILSSKVYHKRHHPKQNSFKYRSYYVILDMLDLKKDIANPDNLCKNKACHSGLDPESHSRNQEILNQIQDDSVGTQYRRSVVNNTNPKIFSINKPNIYSFYDKDHGLRDSSYCINWATNLLDEHNIEYDNIKLMTMPRVLGYLFNPVSFWLCYKENKLIAVIAEVNNTFKETHSYICHKNGDEITDKCWFEAEKVFHVSPFYPRQGSYKFNFKLPVIPDSDLESPALSKKAQVIINYYDNDKLQLGTAIIGDLEQFSSSNLIKEFFRSPLLTLKVVYLIHWQALRIVLKRIKYIPKPEQKDVRVSVAELVEN